MLPRFHSLFLALTIALLIVFGVLGIFTAEASSFRIIVSEVQTHGSVMPFEAHDIGTGGPETTIVPGLPY